MPIGSNGTVVVRAGEMAEAIVLWSNWCDLDETQLMIRVELPDVGGSVQVIPPGTPSCMNPDSRSSLSVEGFTQPATAVEADSRVIAVQQAPGVAAANDDGVWVTGQDRLLRLDTEGRVVWAFDVVYADGDIIGGGTDVAIGEGSVWVTSASGSDGGPRGSTTGGVVKIDPNTNRVVAVRVFTDRTPFQVVAGHGAVWVTTGAGVTRLSVEDLGTEATIDLATDFLALGKERVWALTGDEAVAFLARIDPATNRVNARWRLAATPSGVVEAFGSVWVAMRGSGQLLRLDPDSGATKGVIDYFSPIDALTAGSGSLWVMSAAKREVARIDPATGETVATYLASDPTHLAVGPGIAWVVSYLDWNVTRLPI
jgi:streptogramin lyase